MNKFLNDRDRGTIAEQEVVKIFNKANVVSLIDDTVRSAWDIKSFSDNSKDVITTEVKFDEREATSGNLAVEVYNPRLGKPSGLTVTKAFFWCYVLADLAVWITPVKVLKVYVDNNPPARIIDRGGDGNATLYLYVSSVILAEVFYRIDNMRPERLRHWIHTQFYIKD